MMLLRSLLVVALVPSMLSCSPQAITGDTDSSRPRVDVTQNTAGPPTTLLDHPSTEPPRPDESHWLLLVIHEDSGLPPPHVLLSADAYLGYPYPLPDAGIDFRSQVVLVLSIPTGQGCQEVEPSLDTIVIDEDSRIVYGEFTRVPIEPSCSGLLRSFSYFVAVDRSALPAEFTLQAERELTHPQATASDIVLDTSG